MASKAKNHGRGGNMPERPSITLIKAAEDIIEFLIEHDGYTPKVKRELAEELGWSDPLSRGKPNTSLVERACTLTRDQDEWEDVKVRLGGYRIDYAPIIGGLQLLDPHGRVANPRGLVHFLHGDATRENQHRTENRRRIPVWKTAGDAMANRGDHDLARVLWQGEHDINKTGFVSETTYRELTLALRDRGYES